MGKTLNELIEVLKPKQQDFIVWCVREHGERPDMHRGLLPFLDAQQAFHCLTWALEMRALHADSTGTRFIREIISLITPILDHPLCKNTASAIIQVNHGRMVSSFGQYWVQPVFHARLRTANCKLERSGGLVRVEMTNRPNHWKITAPREALDSVTTWFAEHCR